MAKATTIYEMVSGTFMQSVRACLLAEEIGKARISPRRCSMQMVNDQRRRRFHAEDQSKAKRGYGEAVLMPVHQVAANSDTKEGEQ